MSISCGCGDWESSAWWYVSSENFCILQTKRSRKCVSCGCKIDVGDECVILHRHRSPQHDIEESIYGDEVPLADWHFCEDCGGVYYGLEELGYCVMLEKGEDLRKVARQLREGNLP